VILHCQNVNFNEINQKIDKYSEKFLTILQNILIQEVNSIKSFSNFNTMTNSEPLCMTRHKEILKKLEINEDDSCLSDLENEIFKSCHHGNSTTKETKAPSEKSKIFSTQKTNMEIFNITKEAKPNKIQQSFKELSFTTGNKNSNHSTMSVIDTSIQCDKNIEEMLEESTPAKSLEISNQYDMKDYPETEKTNEFEQIRAFEKFVEDVQNSQIYQPLNNMYNMGLETCTDSRKVSECFMDVDGEISTTSIKEIEIETEACGPIQKLNSLESFNFKVPRAYKIDPMSEPYSNMNLYKKSFFPKVNKSKEKLKNLVPFLKEFNPKFLKKENIDKKILRRFRNFVKIIYKAQKDTFDKLDPTFWKNFTTFNLLPPMNYMDEKILIEFKSFNTKYMLWLFSKNGSVELYKDFASKSGEDILYCFIKAYDLVNNKEEGIISKLRHYIFAIPDIYSKKYSISKDILASDSYTTSHFSCTTKLKSEEVLDYYLGPELNSNKRNSFYLPNFPDAVYPRCGKKDDQYRNLNEEYIDYESYLNFADSALNASMDSIQSVE
jgi:hypothetical protein